MKKTNGLWKLWHGGTGMFPASLPRNLHHNILHRQIFPNKPGLRNKRTENDNAEPDPDSIRSKAKRARLQRAKKRQRQAAEE
jgi:hypothetical protein